MNKLKQFLKTTWFGVVVFFFHLPNYVFRFVRRGILRDKRQHVFLSGPMEYAENLGASWREDLSAWLRAKGDVVFNPCEVGNQYFERAQTSHDEFDSMKSKDKVHLYRETMNIFQYQDILGVLNSDYVIVHWHTGIEGSAGTQGEITFAKMFGIPVYMVSDRPLEKISGWAIACCDHIFYDFEDLKGFLSRKAR